jgi:hypothetical protein
MFTKCALGLAGALALVGLGLSVAGLLGGALGDLRADTTASEGVTLDIPDPMGLTVELGSQDLVLLPSPDDALHITYTPSRGWDYTYGPEATVDGDRYYCFQANAVRSLKAQLGIQLMSPQATAVTMQVPEGLAVTVSAVSGDVDIPEGLQVQRLEISTTSGDLDLCAVQVAEAGTLSAVSGDVDLEDCTMGTLTCTTVSGDQDLDTVTVQGDITLQSTSGDISLTLTAAPPHRAASITSQSGAVTVQGCDPAATAALYISTTSGDIAVGK